MGELLGLKAKSTYIDDITIVKYRNATCYNANKEAIDRMMALSDADFEKEISQFPEDTQTFFRIAREHGMD